MENAKYYFKTDEDRGRSNPAGIMRRYTAEGAGRDEVYNFRLHRWTETDFFDKYRLGHMDFDYVEVPQEEAEAMLAEKLRRQAERGR
ncbi:MULTISPECIES: hypothetical protein [Glycomyces]|uniref:Uncharacterized protein n=2 Tax=Glycomyces TaxID=58113 RepID=A0A9X3PR60_9ACTN|nr:hypothetical protein [Glycomyces lechevalierae]MDA1387772.1 hypothetical protein [Glycomyces lechevalierae]MDR7337404.1 hypothetical protein [Glycomyces lechevalierae]